MQSCRMLCLEHTQIREVKEKSVNKVDIQPHMRGSRKFCQGGGVQICNVFFSDERIQKHYIVGHPEPEKKILLAFLSTFWHPCSKCILMCFKKDRGGCQVWKCPKVPELGQRSTECKFLYICQILAFLSISYPKL